MTKIYFTLIFLFTPVNSFAKPELRPLNASFSEEWKRYPPPIVVNEILRKAFIHSFDSSVDFCLSPNGNSTANQGYNNPATGKPTYTEPNSQFSLWLANCVNLFLNFEIHFGYQTYAKSDDPGKVGSFLLRELSQAELADKYTQRVLDHCSKNNPQSMQTLFFSCEWRSLPQEVQDEFILFTIHRVIGDESVIVGLELAHSMTEFKSKITHLLQMSLTSEDTPAVLKNADPNQVRRIYATLLWILFNFDLLRY